ncbi:MAG TPA: hypothetical protein VGC51_12245, partial [Hansschlegelia sp.]
MKKQPEIGQIETHREPSSATQSFGLSEGRLREVQIALAQRRGSTPPMLELSPALIVFVFLTFTVAGVVKGVTGMG